MPGPLCVERWLTTEFQAGGNEPPRERALSVTRGSCNKQVSGDGHWVSGGDAVLTVHGLELGRPWCPRNQREGAGAAAGGAATGPAAKALQMWSLATRMRSGRERSMSLTAVSVLPSNEPSCPS